MKVKKLLESPSWRVLTSSEVAKVPDDDISGGRVGSLEGVTFDELVDKLGPPSEVIEPGEGEKSTVLWVIQGADGTIASIYDYKQSTHYNNEEDIDFSTLHADPTVRKKLRDSQKKKTSLARKLGIHNIRDWSIGASFKETMDSAMNRRGKDKKKKLPTLDLVYSIFPGKVWDSILPGEVRTHLEPDAKPYTP
jgi:hypothetical protein